MPPYKCLTMSSISRCFGTMLELRNRISVSRLKGPCGLVFLPSGPRFVAYVVKTKIVKNKRVPILLLQLTSDVPGNIMVNLGEVLSSGVSTNVPLKRPARAGITERTDTKKLDVPSCRSKVSGKSFSHVSSPNITRSPESLALIWASHVSCAARLDVVSPSSMFRMASRNDGMEPVVMDLRRGMVTVGDRAKAVKGIAAPSRISLA